MELSHAVNGRQMDSKENPYIQPKKKMKYRAPMFKMGVPAYSSRGWNRPHMA
jgi:hypothetical protein